MCLAVAIRDSDSHGRATMISRSGGMDMGAGSPGHDLWISGARTLVGVKRKQV